MLFPSANTLFYRYLLDKLSDRAKRRVEKRLRSNDKYKEQLETAEHKLVAAYVFGGLKIYDHDRFDEYYICSDERHDKVRLAESLYLHVRRKESFIDADTPLDRYLLGKLPAGCSSAARGSSPRTIRRSRRRSSSTTIWWPTL